MMFYIKEYDYSYLEQCRNLKLKDSDVEEMKAINPDATTSDTISDSLACSDISYMVFNDDILVALFGIRVEDSFNIIWFLSSDMSLTKRSFLKDSKDVLDIITREYGTVSNIVSTDNKESIKYLKFLKFEFGDDMINVNGNNFKHFWKHRGNYV